MGKDDDRIAFIIEMMKTDGNTVLGGYGLLNIFVCPDDDFYYT